jgi:hypothetical protein
VRGHSGCGGVETVVEGGRDGAGCGFDAETAFHGCDEEVVFFVEVAVWVELL